MSEGTCTKCGRHILWATNHDTKNKVALDKTPMVFEVTAFRDGTVEAIPIKNPDGSLVNATAYYLPHLASCSGAAAARASAGSPQQSHPSSGKSKGKDHYDDTDFFPFGNYGPKGEPRMFSKVPAYYLTWFLEQPWAAEWPGVKEYCERNKSAIDKEESEADQRQEERQEQQESAPKGSPLDDPDSIPF